MPTYEYECERGHRFEQEQRITDAPLTSCTSVVQYDEGRMMRECKAPCKRLVSGGVGFSLQGSGWAKDGYK